ncbi:unnamed protein product [Pleuronectes platessa]|uniref:Sodium-dependent phosphate transport protein 2A n=1 Tax=Pleuronectes platessa TaxID=8262 RepID=A0A9N7YEC0_PLEPL|nr:unnamed protein product [Pleuronectes platessa]
MLVTLSSDFAGATIHDCFNWLSVLVLLPLEGDERVHDPAVPPAGYLPASSSGLERTHRSFSKSSLSRSPGSSFRYWMLHTLDECVITGIVLGNEEMRNRSLVKEWCQADLVPSTDNVSADSCGRSPDLSMQPSVKCRHLFVSTPLSDLTVGLILLAASLVVLCSCLLLLVKLLNTLLKGNVAKVIHKVINTDLPYPYGIRGHVCGSCSDVRGPEQLCLHFSHDSAHRFRRDQCGTGLSSHPRLQGGTTATALLAALASPQNKLAAALLIALCHLSFNICGILLWFPLLFMRLPIRMARVLGDHTAQYRSFSFILTPSLAGAGPLTGRLASHGWPPELGLPAPVDALSQTPRPPDHQGYCRRAKRGTERKMNSVDQEKESVQRKEEQTYDNLVLDYPDES